MVGPEDLGEKAWLREELFWYKSSHLDVGGVSDSVIGIGTFFNHPQLCWTGHAKVRRTLGHVLKSVLFGSRFNDKKELIKGCLNKESVVTLGPGFYPVELNQRALSIVK